MWYGEDMTGLGTLDGSATGNWATCMALCINEGHKGGVDAGCLIPPTPSIRRIGPPQPCHEAVMGDTLILGTCECCRATLEMIC
jgi:hypothetical protein